MENASKNPRTANFADRGGGSFDREAALRDEEISFLTNAASPRPDGGSSGIGIAGGGASSSYAPRASAARDDMEPDMEPDMECELVPDFEREKELEDRFGAIDDELLKQADQDANFNNTLGSGQASLSEEPMKPKISLRRVATKKSFVTDSLLMKPLRLYAQRVMVCPWMFIFVYATIVVLLVVMLWKPLEIENSFSAFVRADGSSMRNREALELALKERKGYQTRRLDDRLPFFNRKDLQLIYKAKSGNALDERVLREVRDLETRLRALPSWMPLCNLVTMENVKWLCSPGESITALVWPTQVKNASVSDRNQRFQVHFDGNGQELMPLPAVLSYMQYSSLAAEQPLKSRELGRYFPKTFDGDVNGSPAALRTRFSFYLTFAYLGDSLAHQNKERKRVKALYEAFVMDELYPVLKAANEDYQYVDIYYSGSDILAHEIDVTLMNDILWAGGSILFVTAFMWWYIRSLMVAIGCFCIIFASVPIAYVLTPAASTTIASFLSLFLVTVIDIDVVFVMVDFWEQGDHIRKKDKRIAWMMAHAGKSCLATSLTTSMGFFSNLMSALQPLREFGMFMGLSVMTVYILALLFLPPLILIKDSSLVAAEKAAKKREEAKSRKAAVHFSSAAIVPVGPSSPRTPMSVGSSLPVGVSAKAYDAASPRSKVKQLENSLPELVERPRIFFMLFHLVEMISRCTVPIVIVAGICFPVFVTFIVMHIELDLGVPQIFNEEHNQIAGPIAAKLFGSASHLNGDYAPPLSGAACDATVWMSEEDTEAAQESSGDCVYYWCDQDARYKAPANSDIGECIRSPVRRDGVASNNLALSYSTSGCSSVAVHTRLTASTLPSREQWQPVISELMLNISRGIQNGFVDPTRLGTFASENWETGRGDAGPLFETNATATLSRYGPRCEISTMCFFGQQPCEVAKVGPHEWLSAGQYRMQLNTSVAGAEIRRLDDEGAEIRKLATNRMDVAVIWGVKAPAATPLVGAPEWLWDFDERFELSNPWAQRAIWEVCNEPGEDLFVIEVDCWITSFKGWLEENGRKFPSRDFDTDVAEWYAAGDAAAIRNVWVKNDKVVACKVMFYVNVSPKAKVAAALEYQKVWNQWMEKMNEKATITANRAWHTTQMWVTAEAQDAIITSTAETILVECFCGWLGILTFTGDPFLSALVLGLVVTNVSGLAFFMVVLMKWALGPIEIIFLVVFLGYSVTFGLHMAHNYAEATEDDEQLRMAERLARRKYGKRNGYLLDPADSVVSSRPDSSDLGSGCKRVSSDGDESPDLKRGNSKEDPLTETKTPWADQHHLVGIDLEPIRQEALTFTPKELRKARTRLAVLHVGGAILSSAFSTIGSSLFLLLCTMTLFRKLGLIVISVTCLSIVFTLIALPAILMLFGPQPVPFHRRLFRRIVKWMQPTVERMKEKKREKEAADALRPSSPSDPFVSGQVLKQ